MAEFNRRATQPGHLFIISSSPYEKPDVATEYQRRAHAARYSRRKGAQPSKHSKTPDTKHPIDQRLSSYAATHTPGIGFSNIPNLDIGLLSCLKQLASITVDLNNRNQRCTKTTFSMFLEVRTNLEATPSQTAGLAFLKPMDLIYEACRFSALIYCDLLAMLPCVIAAGRSASVHLSPMQRSSTLSIYQETLPDFMRRPAYGLHYVLNSLFADSCWDQYPEVMRWATVMGGIGSVGTPDRKWYADAVRTRCAKMLENFSEIKTTLGDYLWLDDACDEERKRLWNEANKIVRV